MSCLRESRVKIRQERQCDLCYRIFPIGSTMVSSVGVHDGEFSAAYACETCDTLVEKHPEQFIEDGFYISEYPVHDCIEGLDLPHETTPEQLLEHLDSLKEDKQ